MSNTTTKMTDTLFEIRDLRKWYRTNTGDVLASLFANENYLKAVDDINFDINNGEILGLAGQSGCGKSTLGELLLGLQPPTDGEIHFRDRDMTEFNSKEMQQFRRNCQVIFQDPYEALNPRFTVARSVEEPLKIHGIGDREERDARTIEALEDAGLTPAEKFLDQLPNELSGGQRQRVCIARALVLDPDFLVADEPVSMLDVSVRTSILHLFERLQQKRDLTMLYISHDLSTINYLADRTMIMYLGNIVELGQTKQVIHDPAHPYTEALLEAVPTPDPDETRTGSRIRGSVPDPINLPTGCRFHPRCDYATDECLETEPPLEPINDNQETACYHPVNE